MFLINKFLLGDILVVWLCRESNFRFYLGRFGRVLGFRRDFMGFSMGFVLGYFLFWLFGSLYGFVNS